MPGQGPQLVVTDKGIFRFSPESGEMVLDTIYPDVELDEIREGVGWDLIVAPDLKNAPPPTPDELHLIREELDPQGRYRK